MNTKKRILSLFVVMMMAIGLMTTAAFAADAKEVSTKAELDAAIANAGNGDIIKLTADIVSDAVLIIDTPITLDLGGNTLTTTNGWGGLQLKNGCSVKNGTLLHTGRVNAIKVWDVVSIEDLVIEVTDTTEGKTVGGIAIQENAAGVESIKNVTMRGVGLDYGIETYNCGNAPTPVIGSMENVTIDAVGTGMLISAPCGTATGCTIKGGVSGIDMLLKGTYSVSLDLVNCKVEGGEQAVYAHDEQKGYTYVGNVELTADADTSFASDNGALLKLAKADRSDINVSAVTADAAAKVVGADGTETYYTTLEAAEDAADTAAGETVENLKLLEIWDADDLMAFAEAAKDGDTFEGKTVKLMADIDLNWAEWYPINFYGTFEGGNHTISNLTYIPRADGRMGFFQLAAGPVSDLTLDGIKGTVPANGRFGGFTRYLNAPAENVHVKNIEVTTTDTLGWVGGFTTYTAGGNTNNCSVDGLTVNAQAGADLIAGFISLTSNRQLYQNCTVDGFKVTVIDTDSSGCGIGGFVAQTQTGWNNPKFKNDVVENIDVVAEGLVDVGGFIAWPGAHTEYAEDCSTQGKIDVTGVTSENCFAGGFFGNLGWNCDLGYMGHVVTNCSADVDITTKVAPAGGFVGSATNSNNNSMYATFNNCTASGDITSTDNAPVGGFAGDADRGVYNNCTATGAVSGYGYVGGFIGHMVDVTPKYDGRYPAGTRDYLADATTLDSCTGSNNVTGAASKTAGLIGFVAEGADVTLNGNNYSVEPQYNPVGGVDSVKENVASVTGSEGSVTYYETLTAAIADAEDGDIITLLADGIAENVTVVQAEDVKIIIDGDGKTYKGTITVDGKSAAYDTAALTIQNVKFDATGVADACIMLGVSGDSNTRYTNHVTVTGCTFTDDDNSAVGIKNYTGGCKNLAVNNCTATGMHSLMQVKGVDGLTIDTVTVTSTRGISVGTSTNVSVKNSTITATGDGKYGIRADGSGAYTMTVEDCTITAAKPVVVRKTTGAYELTISGDETTMTATGSDGCVIITSGDDEETPVKPDVAYTANITGGTYSDDETAEVKDGYIVKKNSDTEYVVVEKSGLTSGTYMADPTGYTASRYYVANNNDGTWTVYYVAPSGGSSSSSGSYAVTTEKAENGTVKVSPSRADAGDTVTITVTPDKGYELDTLTVTDKNGKEVELTKKSDSKYTFKMPSGKVTVEATFTEAAEFENPFVDVSEGSYYYDAVLWAAENGITGGTSANTFSPNAVCTRAQTVTFLWRAAGSPEPKTAACPFEDVDPSAYYYKAVLWAAENGITSGTSATTFSPNATVTRAQNVTFLWRWAESPAAEQANPFVDVEEGKYYHDAVIWAAEQGITAGTNATTFSPDDPCLRSQIVTFLYRYLAD